MSLVFSAILPHSPLLVPNIGKENLALFFATLPAAATLAEEFKNAAPDLVIVLSGYGPKRQSGFTFNVAPAFKADLTPFGDLVSNFDFSGSLGVPARFRELLEGIASLHLTTQENLDYASVIPLHLLNVASTTPVFPISISGGSARDNYEFGRQLQACLVREDVRVAIVASADLSHKLSKKSPAGYSAKAKKLDQRIVDYLVRSDFEELIGIPEKVLNDAAIEDMNVLTLFFGLISGYERSGQLLSYEAPFGVGHAIVAYR